MVDRSFYPGRIVLALVISIAIFIAVFSFAEYVSYRNYQQISERNTFVQDSLNELEAILANISCDERVLFSASERLDQVGAGLALLENRIGKSDARVLEQKGLYSELELRHFKIVSELNRACNHSFLTVMFFYSNSEASIDESELAGAVLRTFKNRAPERVMIYSFDYNLESEVVRDLIENYSIKSAPSFFIDERDIISDIQNINQLESYL